MFRITALVFPVLGTAVWLRMYSLPFYMDASCCSFQYELVTEDGKICLSSQLEMDEVTYDAWGVDNMYCVNWLVAQLGLTLDTTYVAPAETTTVESAPAETTV